MELPFLFLDTETTDSDDKARLLQLAYHDAKTGERVNELFKPPVPIAIDAMSVHHITNEMVAEKPSFEASGFRERLNSLLNQRILVAYNAPFDIRILANEGVKTGAYIDAMRVAMHVVDSPKYKLQYLRYLLSLNVEAKAHDAEGDISVLEALYGHLVNAVRERFQTALGEATTLKMLELTNAPALLKAIAFGEHKGETFESLAQTNRGYLGWLISRERKRPAHEQNENLIHTLKYNLDKYPKADPKHAEAKPAEPAKEETPKAEPDKEEDVRF
jgi:exodeoxyribonuclease X